MPRSEAAVVRPAEDGTSRTLCAAAPTLAEGGACLALGCRDGRSGGLDDIRCCRTADRCSMPHNGVGQPVTTSRWTKATPAPPHAFFLAAQNSIAHGPFQLPRCAARCRPLAPLCPASQTPSHSDATARALWALPASIQHCFLASLGYLQAPVTSVIPHRRSWAVSCRFRIVLACLGLPLFGPHRGPRSWYSSSLLAWLVR
jgi:hypothetical protein